jgi:hypothetical protein
MAKWTIIQQLEKMEKNIRKNVWVDGQKNGHGMAIKKCAFILSLWALGNNVVVVADNLKLG